MMERIAHLNPERTRRYYLYRTWDEPLGFAMFIGLNPSIADEEMDDHTIRKCIGGTFTRPGVLEEGW